MAAGDRFQKGMRPDFIFDSQGNLAGIRNPHGKGSNLRGLTNDAAAALMASGITGISLSGGYSVFSGPSPTDSAATFQQTIQAPGVFTGVRLVYNNSTLAPVNLASAKVASPTIAAGNGSTLTYTSATFAGAASVSLPARTGTSPDEVLTQTVSDYIPIVPANSLNLLTIRSYFDGNVGGTSGGTTTDISDWVAASGMAFENRRRAGVTTDGTGITVADATITPDGVIFEYAQPTTFVLGVGGSHIRGNQTSGNAFGFVFRACQMRTAAANGSRIWSPYCAARGGSGQEAAVANLANIFAAGLRPNVVVMLNYSGNDLDFSLAGFMRARGQLGRQIDLCRMYGARPIICTAPVITSPPDPYNALRIAHNLWTTNLRNFGFQVLDIAAMYDDPSGAQRLNPIWASPDNIHVPNAAQAVSAAALATML